MKELDKWSDCHKDVNTIEDFIAWCNYRKEGRIILALHLETSDTYVPANRSIRQLLEEYFEIDTCKLETERRALLKEIRGKTTPKRLFSNFYDKAGPK